MKKFFVNIGSGVPVYKQIMKEIILQIDSGILKEREKMPTVRELAVNLHVNPNTVARAYRELERLGIIETFVGRGTFVKGISKEREIDVLIDKIVRFAKENGIPISYVLKKIKERGGEK